MDIDELGRRLLAMERRIAEMHHLLQAVAIVQSEHTSMLLTAHAQLNTANELIVGLGEEESNDG